MSTKYIVSNLSGQTINGQSIDPKYKVFTALLTQSGGDAPSDKYNGDDIYIGVTYCIVANDNNYDLTVYGAPNSNVGTCFVCNQVATLPGFWTGIQLSYNDGAPVVTVLENTIGNIWFTFENTGQYSANSNGLFTDNKTTIFGGYYDGNLGVWVNLNNPGLNDTNNVFIQTGDPLFANGYLNNTPIEIRVYN